LVVPLKPEAQPQRSRKVSDRKLFATVVKAHKSGIVVVSANAARLNHPGSPVWNRDDNIAPLFGLLSAAFAAFFVNVFVGFGVTLLAVLLYVSLVRTWVLLRVSTRAVAAALDNLPNWERLWRRGGLAILDTSRGSVCLAPHGDWRTFASSNLPLIVLEPAERRRILDFARESAILVPTTEDPAHHPQRPRQTPKVPQMGSGGTPIAS
jgi:hypothetical protein